MVLAGYLELYFKNALDLLNLELIFRVKSNCGFFTKMAFLIRTLNFFAFSQPLCQTSTTEWFAPCLATIAV